MNSVLGTRRTSTDDETKRGKDVLQRLDWGHDVDLVGLGKDDDVINLVKHVERTGEAKQVKRERGPTSEVNNKHSRLGQALREVECYFPSSRLDSENAPDRTRWASSRENKMNRC